MILPVKQEIHQPLLNSEKVTLKTGFPTLSKTKSDDLKARFSHSFKKKSESDPKSGHIALPGPNNCQAKVAIYGKRQEQGGHSPKQLGSLSLAEKSRLQGEDSGL